MRKIVVAISLLFLIGCGGSSGGKTNDEVNHGNDDNSKLNLSDKSVIVIVNNYQRGGYGRDDYDRAYFEQLLVDYNVFCEDYQFNDNDLISHLEKYDGREIDKEYEKSNGYICSERTFTKKHPMHEANSTIIYYSKD